VDATGEFGRFQGGMIPESGNELASCPPRALGFAVSP
jgi:hypothetical protein